MRALYIRQHASAAELRETEAPKPEPGPEDVLVKVLAAGVNPSDVAGAEGRFPHAPLPRVVGRDFAGEIVDGPAGLVGTQVWGSGGDLGISRHGTHAEFVVIPRDAVTRRPKNLTIEQAAAVGVPFITAYTALADLGNLKQGEWVIITGAAGAVGQAAVQIAHAQGARVVALVRNEAERARIESPKVHAIATSEADNLEEVARRATDGRGCDLALNGVGASVFGPVINALADGGRQVVYSVAGGREASLDLLGLYRRRLALLGLNTAALNAIACARILDRLTPLFESGAIQPPAIEARYPLSQGAEAYERVAAGTAAKVVLVL
jgi:NADPH:quinone reductase-like Zn-dependent oxidoreductase